MSNSTENDNGRYYEYLITEFLHKNYGVSLTQRSMDNQLRDSKKKIDLRTKEKMIKSLGKISKWISCKIKLDKETLLDRKPDLGNKSHSDITLSNRYYENLNLSIKHNSTSIFHGRFSNICEWIGLEKDSESYNNYKKNIEKHKYQLHLKIPVGTNFTKDGKFLNSYAKDWSNYVYCIFNEMRKMFLILNSNEKYLLNIYKKIIGTGKNEYRILLKGNSITIENLDGINMPKNLEARIIQKERANFKMNFKHVWYLVIEFNNGLKIEARSKHDSSKMSKTPPLKPDWQVVDWGKSGMIKENLKLQK